MVLFVIVNVISINAKEVSVENLDLKITSKEQFYCQPIFNENGECLIQASYEVFGKKTISINGDITYKEKDIKKVKDTKFSTSKSKSLKKDEKYAVNFEFWAKESGKFDVIVNGLILDPYYNITINSSYPSYHLINLTPEVDSDNVAVKVEISNELSDMNNMTSFVINKVLYPKSYYPFEENGGIKVIDVVYGNNGTNYGGAKYVSSRGSIGVGNYALFFNSTNKVNVSSNQYSAVNYPQQLSVFCWVNASKSNANPRGVIAKGFVTSSNSNWNLNINGGSNTTQFGLGNGTANIQISTPTNSFIQGIWQHIGATLNSSTMCIFINGQKKTCSGITVKYKDNGKELNIGRRSATSNPFLGKIDECVIFNRSISHSEVNNLYLAGVDGNAIKVYYNYTFNISNDYWLRVRRINNGIENITVYAYSNVTSINNSESTSRLSTSGWYSIPINNIIKDNYNSAFRLISKNALLLSEVLLLEQIEDNFTPSITNCQVNDSELFCNDTVRFTCDVTDDNDLNSVYFGINYSFYDYSLVDRISPYADTYYKDITFTNKYNLTQYYNWIVVNATDIVGKNNESILNILFNYTCNDVCVEDWINDDENITICLINDTYFYKKLYLDINDCGTNLTLPADNGTINFSSCNYCDELIVEEQTECIDDVKEVYFVDLFFDTCCNVTNKIEDCSIIYNSSYDNYTTLCDSDIRCYYNSNPFLKMKIPFTSRDKIDFYCRVNLTNYSCVSEVVVGENVLQTNPDYLIISMFGPYNSFEGTTKLLRGYYKKGTLLPENLFTVRVKCSDGNSIHQYEWVIDPQYKSLAFEAEKGIWLKRNWGYVFALVFITGVVGLMIYAVRA